MERETLRVRYRCWARRFDEEIPLTALRVLPAYSVIPRWRDALTIGSHIEVGHSGVETWGYLLAIPVQGA